MHKEAAGFPPGHGMVQWSSMLSPNHTQCCLGPSPSLPTASPMQVDLAASRSMITLGKVPWIPLKQHLSLLPALLLRDDHPTRDKQTPRTIQEISATKSSPRTEFLCLKSVLIRTIKHPGICWEEQPPAARWQG